MKITDGINKGFYNLPVEFVADNSLVMTNTVYSRLKLSDNKRIQGFNKTYLPFVDGFYYVPRTDGLDIRKVIYSLENKDVPSSGNTETFLRDFENTIAVPDDWCPYYLDPCNYDWCMKCDKQKFPKSSNVIKVTSTKRFIRGFYLFFCMVVISAIIILSLRS